MKKLPSSCFHISYQNSEIRRQKMDTFLENKVFSNLFLKNFLKVHIFWESHKILGNLHCRFDWHCIGKIYCGDFQKCCCLLKIYGWFLTSKNDLIIQNWYFLSADFWVLVRDIKVTLKGHFSSVANVMCTGFDVKNEIQILNVL